jgi:DNA-directed RNA polymerase specialized sigma24 family protein
MESRDEGVVEMSFNDAKPDLETIFRAQYVRIARVIAGVIRDPARAGELAVEVFLKWEQAPEAHGEGAEGWVVSHGRSNCLERTRRRTLRGRYERLIGLAMGGKTGVHAP